MSMRPARAKGAYTGLIAPGTVGSVSAVLPVQSTGGITPQISLKGLVGLGTAGQLMRMNAGATALEWTGTVPQSVTSAFNVSTPNPVTDTAAFMTNLNLALAALDQLIVATAATGLVIDAR